MRYRSFTAIRNRETLYCVTANWICINTEWEFVFLVVSELDNVVLLLNEYLKDFKCHIR